MVKNRNVVAVLLLAIALVGPHAYAGPCDEPDVAWSFQWENDSFPGASRSSSDRFYTNGIRVTRSRNGAGNKLFNSILDRLWFPSKEEGGDEFCSRTALRVGHQFYTPQSITRESLDVNDRPYAGLFYVSNNLAKASKPDPEFPSSPSVIRSAELQLGFVGPAAGARGIQTEWHALSFIDAPKPLGWHNQIPNEIVANINLTASRRIAGPRYFDIIARADAGIGTIFTGARVGATMRVGNYLASFPYQRIEPAMLTRAFTSLAEEATVKSKPPDLVWWVFAGADGELVLRDVFLDGTLFSSSHGVDAERFRSILNAGIHLEYKGHAVDLMWVNHSKEFSTQSPGIDRHEYLSIGYSRGFGK